MLYDPRQDPDWLKIADYRVINDVEHYLEIAKQSNSCMLFIDESPDACGHYDKDSFWLATQSRHLGHSCFFITQRAELISPTVRANCDQLYLFKTGKKDAARLAEEFGKDELTGVTNFKRGEYLYTNGFDDVKYGNVF